ncbi:hypothetical protein V8C35DRAFT_314580 [Trichoderma chlorosporum]
MLVTHWFGICVDYDTGINIYSNICSSQGFAVSQLVKMAAPTRSQLISTANAFLSAYNQWTASSILSVLSPNCLHRAIPGEHPVRTKAEFGEFLERTTLIIRNFRVATVETTPWVVDVEGRRVTMHVKSSAETDIGPYNNEYVFTITISEDGDKVDDIFEFLDSLYTSQFVSKLTKETGKTLA